MLVYSIFKGKWVNGNMAVMADRLACVNSAVSGVCESESDEKRIE